MTDLGVAVVTGGAGLIGRSVCATLAEAGHHVVAVDHDAAHLDGLRVQLADRVTCVTADVTDHEETEQLWRSSEWARDVRSLVCVAGGTSISQQPMENVDPDEFEETLRLNLTATWKWAAEAARVLKPRRNGRIVTFSSSSTLSGLPGGLAPYVASKAGVVGLTRALSRELGPYEITVNCVVPGYVPDTKGTKRAGVSPFSEEEHEAVLAQHLGSQAVPVVIEPSDIAYAVRYLLSPEARAVTGLALHVNGGLAGT